MKFLITGSMKNILIVLAMLIVAYLTTVFIIWNFDLSVLTNKERAIAFSIYALLTSLVISIRKLEE